VIGGGAVGRLPWRKARAEEREKAREGEEMASLKGASALHSQSSSEREKERERRISDLGLRQRFCYTYILRSRPEAEYSGRGTTCSDALQCNLQRREYLPFIMNESTVQTFEPFSPLFPLLWL
jgi:hypothetical protein